MCVNGGVVVGWGGAAAGWGGGLVHSVFCRIYKYKIFACCELCLSVV